MFRFFKKYLWFHRWVYRNPYDRTCKVCGKHEVGHCWSLRSQHRWWWEVFNDGEISKHTGVTKPEIIE